VSRRGSPVCPAQAEATIANLLAQRLHAAGEPTYVPDGDNIRHGLSRDLGFTDHNRAERAVRTQ
jgi:bifunctional enzyme CysN/CysC